MLNFVSDTGGILQQFPKIFAFGVPTKPTPPPPFFLILRSFILVQFHRKSTEQPSENLIRYTPTRSCLNCSCQNTVD